MATSAQPLALFVHGTSRGAVQAFLTEEFGAEWSGQHPTFRIDGARRQGLSFSWWGGSGLFVVRQDQRGHWVEVTSLSAEGFAVSEPLAWGEEDTIAVGFVGSHIATVGRFLRSEGGGAVFSWQGSDRVAVGDAVRVHRASRALSGAAGLLQFSGHAAEAETEDDARGPMVARGRSWWRLRLAKRYRDDPGARKQRLAIGIEAQRIQRPYGTIRIADIKAVKDWCKGGTERGSAHEFARAPGEAEVI